MIKINLLAGLTVFCCLVTLACMVAYDLFGGTAYMLIAFSSLSTAAMTAVAYDIEVQRRCRITRLSA